MDNVISEYQKWKQQGETLRIKAKQAMEGRYRDLLLEAAQIALEYKRDFGATLKPPKATRKKAPAPPAKVDPKIALLQKQKAQVQKKLEIAKAAGKPTRNLDDRLYEIEDELRLASA